MRRALLLSFMLMLTVILTSLAQEGAGTISMFRMVEVDARALAMGGAFVAIANNYSASHWNPAGVAKAGGPRVGGMHMNKSQGINVNLLSGIMPIANFALGVSFASSSITGIPIIDEEGNKAGTIDSNEILLMGSMAMALPRLGYVGGSLKSYSYTLAEERGSRLGFDAGMLITALIPNLSVGAAAFDLGYTLGYAQPARAIDGVAVVSDLFVSGLFKVGAAFTLPEIGLTVAADFDFGAWGQSVLHMGAELAIVGTPIAVRVGGISAAPGEAPGEVKFTRGAGIILKNLRLDVAFVPHRVLGGSWVISGEIVF